jgi:hypothetical protein
LRFVNSSSTSSSQSGSGIPYFLRSSLSAILSLNKRFPHFATVASGVTPYRVFGFPDSVARNTTCAKSSGVDFDFCLPLLAPVQAPGYTFAYAPSIAFATYGSASAFAVC